MTWARVVEFVKINTYSAESVLNDFNEIWGARNVLCMRTRMKTCGTGNANIRRLFVPLVTWWFGGWPEWSFSWVA